MTAALTGRGCKPLALRRLLMLSLSDRAALETCFAYRQGVNGLGLLGQQSSLKGQPHLT